MSADAARGEAGITAGVHVAAGTRYGFLTDTTLCIGCKACEVACKQWNSLPADDVAFSADGYDHTRGLSHGTWRHVKFIEQPPAGGGSARWLFNSDVCKHCAKAGCLEACPTGAIVRTEYGTVLIQHDVCNGCKYCEPSCPFGVITVDKGGSGTAHKCTLCHDRLRDGLEPACAKSCPTDSIQFGPIDMLLTRGRARVAGLQRQGFGEARLYGDPDGDGATHGIGQLQSLFVLMDHPNAYNLSAAPTLPARHILPALLTSAVAAVTLVGAAAVALLADRR
ncbi:MAG: 4Fe-4S dicluster domain-containing protein [Candidatus Rokubacteria bacterium]|nr:4Fe-4S dicluster domain-containing protein [Candidatus Rokubacteria bacterium]